MSDTSTADTFLQVYFKTDSDTRVIVSQRGVKKQRGGVRSTDTDYFGKEEEEESRG